MQLDSGPCEECASCTCGNRCCGSSGCWPWHLSKWKANFWPLVKTNWACACSLTQVPSTDYLDPNATEYQTCQSSLQVLEQRWPEGDEAHYIQAQETNLTSGNRWTRNQRVFLQLWAHRAALRPKKAATRDVWECGSAICKFEKRGLYVAETIQCAVWKSLWILVWNAALLVMKSKCLTFQPRCTKIEANSISIRIVGSWIEPFVLQMLPGRVSLARQRTLEHQIRSCIHGVKNSNCRPIGSEGSHTWAATNAQA